MLAYGLNFARKFLAESAWKIASLGRFNQGDFYHVPVDQTLPKVQSKDFSQGQGGTTGNMSRV